MTTGTISRQAHGRERASRLSHPLPRADPGPDRAHRGADRGPGHTPATLRGDARSSRGNASARGGGRRRAAPHPRRRPSGSARRAPAVRCDSSAGGSHDSSGCSGCGPADSACLDRASRDRPSTSPARPTALRRSSRPDRTRESRERGAQAVTTSVSVAPPQTLQAPSAKSRRKGLVASSTLRSSLCSSSSWNGDLGGHRASQIEP